MFCVHMGKYNVKMNTFESLIITQCSKSLIFAHLILMTMLLERYYCSLHFSDEEAEAQRVSVTCLSTHSWHVERP